MVKVKEDLTGWKQWEQGVLDGRLTVLHQAEDYITPSNGKHSARWLCECNCKEHNKVVASSSEIKSGRTKSCGCLRTEIILRETEKNRKTNLYKLDGDYGIGYTFNDEEFWFDLEDYNKIKDYCWSYGSHGYVQARAPKTNQFILLHRLIMNAIDDESIIVDHKSHPPKRNRKFDNRKSNLRLVTQSENCMNRARSSNNTSGVTGVTWCERDQVWVARIGVSGKRITLGSFIQFQDAVNARRIAEQKYYGKYRYDANN